MRLVYNISIKRHIKNYAAKYFFVCLFFIIGIIIAVISNCFIGQEIKSDLLEYISSFVELLKTQKIDKQELLKQVMYNNFRPICILWLLGITIIGIPIILIFMVIEGYKFGFVINIIINNFGMVKGVLFTTVAIIPQHIIIIPVLFYLGVNGMNFYCKIAKNNYDKKNLFHEFYVYTLRVILVGIIVFSVVLFQTYIQPFFIKITTNFI